MILKFYHEFENNSCYLVSLDNFEFMLDGDIQILKDVIFEQLEFAQEFSVFDIKFNVSTIQEPKFHIIDDMSMFADVIKFHSKLKGMESILKILFLDFACIEKNTIQSNKNKEICTELLNRTYKRN